RELHDDTLQALIALNQRVQLAQLDVNGGPASAGLSRSLAEIQSLSDQTIQNLRRFTRALRPIYLEELGLSAALEMLARENSQPAGLAIQFRRAGTERRLPEAAELALYRIAQEALSNVIRHARASQAELIIDYQPGRVTLVMQDNGIGFSVPESPAEFAPSGHFGFLGMHERAEAIGARLEISSRPGQGTRVAVKLETAPGSEDNLDLTSRQVE
ncbi:MAG TPA: sensor histidine kinase, partial [Anaerolineales bacterium]|nr:sensor histidine kinase [Anaerolineales bacterium]